MYNRRPVELIGGFQCELTQQERNLWTEYSRKLEEYIEYTKSARRADELAIQAIRGVGDWDKIVAEKRELQERADDLLNKLYHIGKSWYGGLRANEERR